MEVAAIWRRWRSLPLRTDRMASNNAKALFLGPRPISNHREVTPMEAYDRLTKLVQDVAEEVRKAEGGNKAAGTRVRKAMQDVKQAAQDVRKDILDARPPGT